MRESGPEPSIEKPTALPAVLRATVLAAARQGAILARLLPHLGWKMLPTRRILFFAATRLLIGLSAVRFAALLPWDAARGWVEFGGRMFVILAIMNLLAHPEGIFMDALARNVERVTGFRIGS